MLLIKSGALHADTFHVNRVQKNSSTDSGAQKNQNFKPKSNSSNVGEFLDVFVSKIFNFENVFVLWRLSRSFFAGENG